MELDDDVTQPVRVAGLGERGVMVLCRVAVAPAVLLRLSVAIDRQPGGPVHKRRHPQITCILLPLEATMTVQ